MDGQTTGVKKEQKFGSSGTLAQEVESGFIMNRILSTPRANKNTPQQREDFSQNLASVIDGLLGTPTSRDWKDTGNMENVPTKGLLGRQIGQGTGMRLQPNFVEYMMGFPQNWTNLEIRTDQSDSKR